MAFQIIRNNIIDVEADAIVNTANPLAAIGPGVDHAIYEAAGRDELLAERKKIGFMSPGEVAFTPAFELNADYIIHTVGPTWDGGDKGERETVAQCYRRSLELADELGCESIAFPLIATGNYGFPKDEALKIALSVISSFLLSHEMEVLLVVYDKESFEVSGKLFSDIKAYIEDEEAVYQPRRRRRLYADEADEYTLSTIGAGIDKKVLHLEKTFQEHLFTLIDRRGLKDPEVYKKANIDRKHFSKIRSNTAYQPSKMTAVALAIALELNLDQTRDLLMRAGLALSSSSVFDRIIEYCIENEVYDIYEINCILFEYDQPLLGA